MCEHANHNLISSDIKVACPNREESWNRMCIICGFLKLNLIIHIKKQKTESEKKRKRHKNKRDQLIIPIWYN